jgi:hypothetical protein
VLPDCATFSVPIADYGTKRSQNVNRYAMFSGSEGFRIVCKSHQLSHLEARFDLPTTGTSKAKFCLRWLSCRPLACKS